MKTISFLSLLLTSLLLSQASRTSLILDDCSSATAWTSFQSIGVGVHHQAENGAVRFDVEFPKGSGYGGIVRNFAAPLPENYEISFMMKATVPPNNFEVKVSGDSSGENIWWVNNKNYTYPSEWKRIIIKKRHLGYAWGTKFAPFPPKLARLEIVVTAGSGGKGSVWIDDVTLTTLPTIPAQIPQSVVTASSFEKKNGAPSNILAGNKGMWISKANMNEWIELDLKYEKEFGAVNLSWDPSLKSVTYDLQTSFDGKRYEPLYSVVNGTAGNVYHFLPESEARFVRIIAKENGAKLPFKLDLFDMVASEKLSTPNQLFEHIASVSPAGLYPRYFMNQQAYWTVVGVPSDTREALISEDGAFEVDRQKFSLEPFVKMRQGSEVLSWSNAITTQTLEDHYLPIPTVERRYDNINVTTTLLASGEPERSAMMARYIIKNTSSQRQQGSFFVTVRPFQVNPSSQWLNYDGGFAKTTKMEFGQNSAVIDDKSVYVSGIPSASGASAMEQGDITDYVTRNSVPMSKNAEHPKGFTSGGFQYPFDLNAGDSLVVIAAVPFTPAGNRWTQHQPTPEEFESVLTSVKAFWKQRLNTVEFTVNPEAQKYVDIIRSYLAYILINKDKNGFQPGSRSYERSWIRDGSMTSDALLKLGITEEPKKYLEWYSSYQYESGAIPCVVDTRGPDPVPEHDSHGELIFACMEYFRFTQDTAFLRARWNTVVGAVNFIQSLRAQRMTPEYKNGDDEKRAFYGLVTESISHEGYSDKAMHSYWDNFFVLKGFKDAAAIAAALGKKKEAQEYDSLALAFRTDLYNSISLAMKNRKINYIPGCVEKGDFDATSTSIALFPNVEMNFVPQPAYNNTFDKYYEWFVQRAEHKIDWVAYTPYEIRNVGTFVYLGQKERAHYALEYFLNDQRPKGWNHWAEVVANGYRTVRFIGDMPHTWVGSDYINAIRAMFVYEIDDAHSVVIGAGLKDEWVKEGLSVKNLPTHYGNLSYSIAPQSSGAVRLTITGSIDGKKSPLLIPVKLLSSPLQKATVNGTESRPNNGYIIVDRLPATVELRY
ncbi:MAG: discoidin domain-containing protein [Bacteroidota bacterium]